MQQVFRSNSSYDMTASILNTQIKFFVNKKGRLYRIIWYYQTKDNGIMKNTWGNPIQESWDLNEANENDLKRAFEELALKNPTDFKALYYTLKEYDNVTFPYIQEVLQQLQEFFNFN